LLLCSLNAWADDLLFFDDFDDEEKLIEVSDPIEPINRLFFGLNALFYKVLLEPASKLCAVILPKSAQKAVDNAWTNLKAPIRIVNNVLQGDMKGAGRETARFLINSTVGVAGLLDPAKSEFSIEGSNEDLGQTLAHWGIGNGIYLVLPIIGPTTLRDSVGFAGDAFLSFHVYYPYVDIETVAVSYGVKAINKTSLNNCYDGIIKNSIEPYIAVRNAYIQYRNCQIEK